LTPRGAVGWGERRLDPADANLDDTHRHKAIIGADPLEASGDLSERARHTLKRSGNIKSNGSATAAD
jgi:hypothetical protein